MIKNGMVLKGTQANESNRYPVCAEILCVDVERAFVCGYLAIEGLTEQPKVIQTYFEGEIVGPRHSFVTNRWDADLKTDLIHWGKFKPFEQYKANIETAHNILPNPNDSEYIFMRWKEWFLVPDHKVTQIIGASYAGFYYICYNCRNHKIDGYYYHKLSTNQGFQRLQLEDINNISEIEDSNSPLVYFKGDNRNRTHQDFQFC